jgi:hypothetical protein
MTLKKKVYIKDAQNGRVGQGIKIYFTTTGTINEFMKLLQNDKKRKKIL